MEILTVFGLGPNVLADVKYEKLWADNSFSPEFKNVYPITHSFINLDDGGCCKHPTRGIKNMKCYLAILAFGLAAINVTATQNRMRGRVLDFQTNQPIPFANVFFANTSILKRSKHPDRGKRLKLFFNSLNINRKDFLQKTGLGYAFFSQLLTGAAEITATTADRISQAYTQLSAAWLLHGTGEMLLEYERAGRDAGSELAEPLPQYVPKALTVDGLADVIRSLQDQLSDHEARIRGLENELAAKNTE